MKPIPRIVIFDYLCYSIGFFLFIVLLEPFGTRDFIKTNVNPYSFYVVEAVCFFSLVVCECLVCFRDIAANGKFGEKEVILVLRV